MPTRPPAQNNQSDPSTTTTDRIEEKLVSFAEQLGALVGTVQAKADGWLDRAALTKEIGRIRDSAVDLLAYVNREDAQAGKTAAKSTATPAAPRGRGPVDAPGKRHRRPPPQERIDRQMGEPRGKQMGQKAFKGGSRRGRG